MIKVFFTTAYRTLSKNKLFTGLNVIGLALGMSLGLLFVAFLSFLSTYDNFHQKGDRIYRVTTQVHDNDENPWYASAPALLAQKLKNEVPGIDKIVRINRTLFGKVLYNGKSLELNGYFSDPEFLEVFDFPMVRGNTATALNNPNTILLSEREGKKIFGDEDPMGKIIEIKPYGNFIVTGIFKDIPENSHMQFDALTSYSTLITRNKEFTRENEENWKTFSNSYVYLLASKNSEPSAIQSSLNRISREKYTKNNSEVSFQLQKLADIVPGPQLYDQIGPSWAYLGIFLIGSLTLIILIPACLNYANLSIAQSLERMKEIGVRKVLGGSKKQIFLQFIVESVSIVLISLIFAYFVFEVIRKDFLNSMIETAPLDLTPHFLTYLGFILFAILVGIGAGILPALYFSKINAVKALKGKEIKSQGRFSLRKIVLTSQFILSLGFIMAVVTMMRQYHYTINYDFGFEQRNILTVELQNTDPQLFKYEFEKIPSVELTSMSSHLLGINSGPEKYIHTLDETDSIQTSSMAINNSFVSNFGLKLIAGKNFEEGIDKNSNSILVNEEFVKELGVENSIEAINTPLVLPSGREVRIRGVLKNFNYTNLQDPIQSFFFEYDPSKFKYANLKLNSGDPMAAVSSMEKAWKNIGGEGKFKATLFSDEIREAYNFYNTIIKLWGFLGLLAITVACMGLLGTVSFSVRKRYKEISIRKVLGAPTGNIVYLLSKDFLILLLIASIITVPIVYFILNNLLVSVQFYSIRTGFFEVLVSLIILMFFGLSTILSQTLKAANSNPADNLRSE